MNRYGRQGSVRALIVAVGVLLASASDARAGWINVNFTGGNAPANAAGGGNLQAIFQAAIDWWEMAIPQQPGGFTLTIDFGWGPLAGAKGQHTLVNQGGNPHRETRGRIVFDNDGTVPWFLDPTPHQDEEYQNFVTSNQNLGGGAINAERRWTNPRNGSAALNRFDLLQTAKHEIGHALGMSNANTAYQAEIADGDIDITAPRPFAGTAIPVTGSHFTNDYGSLMWGGGLPMNERRLQSALDILAMWQVSKFVNVNLNPTHIPEPSSIVLSSAGGVGLILLMRNRARRRRCAA